MNYRCVAASPQAFVRQLAASYLPHGYCFYVTGYVPDRWVEAPEELDRRMIAKFGLDISKSTRSDQRKQGVASVRYLRHNRTWLLLSTHGRHRFFREHSVVHHVTRRPVYFDGYAIGIADGGVRVTVERTAYRRLTTELLGLCTQQRYRPEGHMAAAIRAKMTFEPYHGVVEQHLRLIRCINRRRRSQGFGRIPLDSVRLRRHPQAGPRLLGNSQSQVQSAA